MSIVLALLTQLLHIGLMIFAAPTVAGGMDWLDARWSGRSGPPVLLPWHDLLRWFRKTPMLTDDVSIVSRLAPAVGMGATAAAAALVPSFALGMALSPLADGLVVVSLLTIARAAAALAALDSGTARSGVATQQASARAVLAEPALLLSVVALAVMAGSFNLQVIIVQQREGLLLPATASAVCLTAMLALLFAEVSAGEANSDFHAGRALAVARMTGWLRRLIWVDLIGGLFLPAGMAAADAGPLSWLTGLAAWGLKLGMFMVCLSASQKLFGRIARHSLPDVIGVAALLALLAIIMALASAGTA